ncbi:hypothetical protein Aab01nite_52830 [Paractinoplanes abujensis]|nr:hypothetical protein Aab01nite_52830 [Actinoplanes abujensis]
MRVAAVVACFKAAATVVALVSTPNVASSVSGSPDTVPLPVTCTLSRCATSAEATAGLLPRSSDTAMMDAASARLIPFCIVPRYNVRFGGERPPPSSSSVVGLREPAPATLLGHPGEQTSAGLGRVGPHPVAQLGTHRR